MSGVYCHQSLVLDEQKADALFFAIDALFFAIGVATVVRCLGPRSVSSWPAKQCSTWEYQPAELLALL